MRIRRALLAAALATALAACGGSTPKAGATREVVASFYPLYEIAARVGGDRIHASNLTPPGAEPHDFELAPDDVVLLGEADLVIFLGAGFQPAVERALRSRSRTTIDVLEGVRLLEGTDTNESGGSDPHVWLDPLLMKDLAAKIAGSLKSIDTTGAATYDRNAAAFATEMDALHAELEAALGSCARRLFVTSHAAFGYLAARYDLTQVAIAGISPESEPNPKRLAELRTLVQREGVTTIFTETLASPRIAQTLAREARVTTAVLDPIEGLSEADQKAGKTYATEMRANLESLRGALGCAR